MPGDAESPAEGRTEEMERLGANGSCSNGGCTPGRGGETRGLSLLRAHPGFGVRFWGWVFLFLRGRESSA